MSCGGGADRGRGRRGGARAADRRDPSRSADRRPRRVGGRLRRARRSTSPRTDTTACSRLQRCSPRSSRSAGRGRCCASPGCSRSRRSPARRRGSRCTSARRRRICSCRSTASSPSRRSPSRGSSSATDRRVARARAARGPARALRRLGGHHVPLDEGRAPGRDRAALLRAARSGCSTVVLARLVWSRAWVLTLYVQLALMGLVFAVIGIVQYETRNIFWNPKVRVDNAYAPSGWFYRVNSVFYDPSIYGRFLVVAILASLVVVLRRRADPLWAVAATLTIAITWAGLLPSFSQSSFVALIAAVTLGAVLVWRWRSLALVGAMVAALLLAAVGARRRSATGIEGKSSSSLSNVTSGRSNLVSKGASLAVHHPLIGVGVGGFRRAYADLAHLRGKEPKAAASHTTPITVAAENGFPGLLLLALARRRGALHRLPRARRGFDGDSPTGVRSSLDRDSRALHLLQRALRGPALLGAARARRRRCPRRRAGGRAGVIGDIRARARARAAHRRRRVRLRRHDGAARRGGRRGALRRVLDRDALAARGLRARHARARGARGDGRDRDSRPST